MNAPPNASLRESSPLEPSPLDRWLRRQASRERRIRYLEDALLSNHFTAYAIYRLKYFMLRSLSAVVLHGIRVAFLYYIFAHRAFLTILLIQALSSLLTSFWWGALEVLRARVRQLSRATKPHLIAKEINLWLAFAAALAVAILVGPLFWIVGDTVRAHRPFSVFHLYVWSICFRAAVEVVTLTFHSGMYAIRRIYRPLLAIVGVELSGFLAVLALWPWLGQWSFPTAMVLSTATAAGIVVHYTSRLYRFVGIRPLALPDLGSLQRPRWGTVREFVGAGASYAVMKLDALLVLGLFDARAHGAKPIALFVLLFSISPVIQAGFDWAQLFYFDLKRLEIRCFENLRQRYERLVARLAWVLGSLFWVLGCLCGTAINRTYLGDLYLLMAPFFLFRSVLAFAQVRAFSARRYADLLGSGVLLLGLMVVLRTWVVDERYKLIGLAVGTFVALVALKGRQKKWSDTTDLGEILGVTDWLEHVKRVQEPVRIRCVRLWTAPRTQPKRDGKAREEERWRHRRAAERIARRIAGHGAVTLIHPGRVAWYERAAHPVRIDDAGLLRQGGGLVESIGCSAYAENGAAALRAAQSQRLLGGALRSRRRTRAAALSVTDVKQAFGATFPTGVIYAPDEPIPAVFDTLSSKEKRTILFDAVHFAQRLRAKASRSRFDVTTLCVGGELRLIFLVDREVDPQLRLRWREHIKQVNFEVAVAPVT